MKRLMCEKCLDGEILEHRAAVAISKVNEDLTTEQIEIQYSWKVKYFCSECNDEKQVLPTGKTHLASNSYKEALKKMDLRTMDEVNIFKAYCDITVGYDECSSIRKLEFISGNPLNGEALVRVMRQVVPEYNEFKGFNTCDDIVTLFGEKSQFYVAREGSVCIYVIPEKKLDLCEAFIARILEADEATWEGGQLRLWWD